MVPAPPVGRDRELAQLNDALADAMSSRPRVVIIDGEAGIGKSRLADETVRIASRDGFLAAVAGSTPGEAARVPYGTAIELMLELRRQQPTLAEVISQEDWHSLEPLIRVGNAEPVVTDPGLSTLRLLSAFTELVKSLSRRVPLLIVIEDGHWLDAATLDLVEYVCRRLRGDRIMVLITNRAGHLGARGHGALVELRRLPTSRGIALGPLDEASTATLLSSLPFPPSPQRRREIVTASQGVPFYAVHLGRFDDGSIITPHLRDVLLASISGISPAERASLILVAVLARATEPGQLRMAIGCSLNDFRSIEHTLVDRGLLVSEGQSLTYRHGLLREIVLDDARPSELAEAHGQAASILLASPADVRRRRAVELAHHLREAGDHRAMLEHAVAAARAAAAVWAFNESRGLYVAVRSSWHMVDDSDRIAGLSYPKLLYELARTGRWCGDFAESLRLLDEAQSIPADDVEAADLEYLRGQVLWSAGQMSSSLAAYQRAVSLIDADGGSGRADILAALAHGWLSTGRAEEAVAAADRAVVAADAADLDRPRLQAMITRAAARAQLGLVDDAVVELRRSLTTSIELDDLELVLRSYGNLTYALGLACRYGDLAEAAEEGLAVCRRYGPVGAVASTLVNNQVNALISLGRWDEATSVATEALDEAGAGAVSSHLRSLLASVAVARGDRSEARKQLDLARESGHDNPYLSSALAEVEAELALLDHHPTAARAAISEALAVLADHDDPMLVLDACCLGLRAIADAAELTIPARRAPPEESRDDLLAIAARAATRTGLPVVDAVLAVIEAEAARITGADTAEQWSVAAERQQVLQRPYWQAYCLFRLGTVCLRGQARRRAARALGAAAELAEVLGAKPLLDEITVVMTTSGLQADLARTMEPKRQARSAPLGLTPRERQVLPLLVAGATNRMIARALFISERTASVHVSNILAKLGAANRTEAARLAVTMHLDTDPDGGG
jgi:DNA-binding CsgD family transcriptional regulator/tetratricopeptide (TPR) repeat protein